MSRDTIVLSDAERTALTVLASSTRWVPSGKASTMPPGQTVQSTVAARLRRRGLVKERWERGTNRAGRSYTITRAGMRAIDWVGPVLR